MKRLIIFFGILCMFFVSGYSIPISSCGQINTSGNYELTTDLNSNGTCLTFVSNDVNLDCQGDSIIGNGSGNALYLFNASNITQSFNNFTINNCELKNFKKSLVGFVAFVDFKDSILNQSGDLGFLLTGNYLFENVSIIPKLELINKCSLISNKYPFYEYQLTQNIVNMSISGGDYSCLTVKSDNVFLNCKNYNMTTNARGIFLNNFDNGVFSNCNVNSAANGVRIDGDSINNSFYDFYLNDTNDAINMNSGSNNSFYNFLIENPSTGIQFDDGDYNYDNFFENITILGATWRAMYLGGYGTGNKFNNIIVLDSTLTALNFRSSFTNSTFNYLTITTSGESGVYFGNGVGFHIINNSNISGNTGSNLDFGTNTGPSSNNTILNSYLGNWSKITVYSGDWDGNVNNFYDNTFLGVTEPVHGCLDYPLNLTCNIPFPVSYVAPPSVSVTSLPSFGVFSILFSLFLVGGFLI